MDTAKIGGQPLILSDIALVRRTPILIPVSQHPYERPTSSLSALLQSCQGGIFLAAVRSIGRVNRGQWVTAPHTHHGVVYLASASVDGDPLTLPILQNLYLEIFLDSRAKGLAAVAICPLLPNIDSHDSISQMITTVDTMIDVMVTSVLRVGLHAIYVTRDAAVEAAILRRYGFAQVAGSPHTQPPLTTAGGGVPRPVLQQWQFDCSSHNPAVIGGSNGGRGHAIMRPSIAAPFGNWQHPSVAPTPERTYTFTATTLNVLHDFFYEKHRNQAAPRVPFGTRLRSMCDFFSRAVTTTDIFLLQEFLRDEMMAVLRGPLRNFVVVDDPQAEGCAIAYKPSTFVPIGNPTLHLIQSPIKKTSVKTAMAQLLQLQCDPHVKICFVSAHLPFNVPSDNSPLVLSQLEPLLQFPQNRKYIVGGDFNMEQSKSEGSIEAVFPSAFWANALANSGACCCRTSHDTFSKIDYMFFTTNADRGAQLAVFGAPNVTPTDPCELISHKGNNCNFPFFSDHAAAAVTFKVDAK